MLKQLLHLYEQKAAQHEAPRYGWEIKKVRYALQLDRQGHLVGIQSLMQQAQRGKKMVPVPCEMEVPKGPTRASGVQPFFLCDNAKYFLGLAPEMTKETVSSTFRENSRTKQCFAASQAYHLSLLAQVPSPAAQAICAFFKSWSNEPAILAANPYVQQEWEGMVTGANLVFRVEDQFAQDDPAIRKAWQEHEDDDNSEAERGLCLLTGRQGTLARLHPMLKGVAGAQSSGAALISYNKGKKAYESFGRENAQAYNAPISTYGAFAYTTALNMLLADRTHAKHLGDTTIVYWAEQENETCQDIFSDMFEEADQRTISDSELDAIFTKVKLGQPFAYRDVEIPYENPFYILGLSPNAARISIRFFLQGGFGDFLQHFAAHAERMQIDRPKFAQQAGISLWQLLRETVNRNATNKEAAPLLAGAVFRAIAQDTPYPAALYQQIMLRIRAEQGDNKVNYRRVAFIKAYMIKNKGRMITVSLDEHAAEPAYVLGRLFAELERIQSDANPDTTATIKDRYFNAACATPAATFPVLQKLSQHHLRKLSAGVKVNHEKQLGSIMDLLNVGENPLPRQLSLEQQGVFILGYYHQRQQFFKGKAKKEEPVSKTEPVEERSEDRQEMSLF